MTFLDFDTLNSFSLSQTLTCDLLFEREKEKKKRKRVFLLVCDGEEDLKYVHSSSTLSFIFNKHSHSVTLTHNFKHALNNSSMAVLRPRRVFFILFLLYY